MDQRIRNVGLRIRQARKAAHMTQEELAFELNISTSYMSDIENGKTNIGLEIFMNITEKLQISADWLLRTDVPPVKNIYQNEIDDLLRGFSPNEMQAIIRIVNECKSLLHPPRN